MLVRVRALSQTLAVSHYIKGVGCYPDKTMPEDNAHLLFQALAIDMTIEQLSVVAATIANIGVNPFTGVYRLFITVSKWWTIQVYV